jgi:hypothetical protein
VNQRPQQAEYAPFYGTYVTLVPETDVLTVLERQIAVLRELAASVSADRERFAYAPGKWTIRQMVGHLGDAERVFGYRALCFSRRDQAPLPGFDEQSYVDRASFDRIPLAGLIEELVLVRSANLRLLQALENDQWSATGTANGAAISVRALAYVIAGHVRHHLGILRDRYGVTVPTGSFA